MSAGRQVFTVPQPPPSVTRVVDGEGDTWNRRGDYWCYVKADGTDGPNFPWQELFQYEPLTDATPEVGA